MAFLRRAVPLLGLSLAIACETPPSTELASDSSIYALQESIDGVHLLPPLGPATSASGGFDSSLLASLSVSIEAEDAFGATSVVATFDRATQPGLSRIDTRELYFLDLPAASYLTDASRTYTIRVLHDGESIAASTLDPRVFTLLAANPGFRIGVKVYVDASAGLAPRSTAVSSPCGGGASMSYDPAAEVLSWSSAGSKAALLDPASVTVSRSTSGSLSHPAVGTWTLQYGNPGCRPQSTTANVPAPTCTDGYRNQGEAGIDCGGPCAACPTCSDGVRNQGETGVDCGGPCGACPTCSDGVRNQGETGVDCGGPCSACATCTDGIRNGTETGVDCGGSCPNTCNCAGTFVYWVWVYGGQQQYSRTFHGFARDSHHVSPIPDADCSSRFHIPTVNAIFDQNNRLVDGQYTTNCSNDTPTLTRLSFTPDDPTCR